MASGRLACLNTGKMFKRKANPAPLLPVLAELRDVDSPAAARRAGVEFGREKHFAADLLRVRSWLHLETKGRDVPESLLESEWIGFLALLDERGPWVYVQNVRELQVLSHLYSRLFQAAFPHGNLSGDSLTGRLGVPSKPELVALELEFWRQAGEFALQRHDEWSRLRR